MLSIKQHFHVAYHPESAGTVERANRAITEMLKRYVTGIGKDWNVKLPLVLLAMRAGMSKSTGVSVITKRSNDRETDDTPISSCL